MQFFSSPVSQHDAKCVFLGTYVGELSDEILGTRPRCTVVRADYRPPYVRGRSFCENHVEPRTTCPRAVRYPLSNSLSQWNRNRRVVMLPLNDRIRYARDRRPAERRFSIMSISRARAQTHVGRASRFCGRLRPFISLRLLFAEQTFLSLPCP